jgi:hypothetical protein
MTMPFAGPPAQVVTVVYPSEANPQYAQQSSPYGMRYGSCCGGVGRIWRAAASFIAFPAPILRIL